jgi:GNAT superfamily N-acetyltransferase
VTYDVVPYESHHRDQVLDLQAIHWGADRERNDQLFTWKYEQNPWLRTPKLYLVFHSGELIAMRGFWGSRWEAGSPAMAADILGAGDLVIAPGHRDRGVFTLLMRHVVEDPSNANVPFLFNLSASAPTRLGALSMGWRDIGPVRQVRWERPKERQKLFGAKETTDATRNDPFREIDAIIERGKTPRASVQVSSEPLPDEMAALVRQSGHDGRIRHVRDEAYFQWRFRHPRPRFRFLFHRSPAAIDGYLVLQHKGGDSHVKIVDSEGSGGALKGLLETALHDCGLWRIVCWRASIAGVPDADLARQGFVEVPVKSIAEPFPTVIVLPNTSTPTEGSWQLGGRDVRDASNWDLRQAYGDGS